MFRSDCIGLVEFTVEPGVLVIGFLNDLFMGLADLQCFC